MLTACYTDTSSSSTTPKSELDIAVEEIVDYSITPALNNFFRETETLSSVTESFCASENKVESDLITLQEQWITTNNAWFKLSPYLLGPLTTEDFLTAEAFWYIDSYRQRGNDVSATVRSDITDMLAASDTINAATFSNKRFNQVGLLALELLLFETSATQSNTIADITSEYQTTSRKCEILKGQTNELYRRVAVIHNGWNQDYRNSGIGYRDLLVNKQLENTFTDSNDIDGTGTPSFTRLVVSTQSHLDYLTKRNITTSSAQVSNSIWQALGNTYNSLQEFLAGTDNSSITLYQMMDNGYDANITTLKENMKFFKLSIDEKNTVNFKSFSSALDGNFKRELPQSLNAELGLNFTDGD
jgi:predicted lipoprotein